jgi:sarcosine oxidase, subunit gamma
MSEAVSVKAGAGFEGAVTLRDAGLRGMITLRGDLGSEAVARAVKSATGLSLPAERGLNSGKKGAVGWMSPDELLLFTDYDKAEALVAKLGKALGGEHALVVNVSDARTMFTLTGKGLREVIAKGSPADMSPDALPIGEIRRSRLAQVAVAFWLEDAETLHLVCFRSLGEHVWNWLCNAAAKGSLPDVLGDG